MRILGSGIFPGGHGRASIVIFDRYVAISTIKGEWPVVSIDNTGLAIEWAQKLVNEAHHIFHEQVIIRTREHSSGKDFGLVYFIGIEHFNCIKIGSTKDLAKRIVGIQTSMPFNLFLYYSFPGNRKEERLTHEVFSPFRLKGEWFSLDGVLRKYIEDMTHGECRHVDPWDYVSKMSNVP